MAWLSGLADKAENLLNKIDKNTASILNKDKYEPPQPQLTEVTWVPPEPPRVSETAAARAAVESPKHSQYASPAGNIASLAPFTAGATSYRDDELFTYLNTPDASPRRMPAETASPPTPSSLSVEHPTDTTDSTSELSMHSGHSSPSALMHTSVQVPHDDSHDTGHILDNAGIIGQISEPAISNGNNTDTVQADRDLEWKEKHLDIHASISSSNHTHVRKYLLEMEKSLEERNQLLGKQQTDHQKEIVLLNEKLQALEAEKLQLSKQIIELQSTLERSRLEVNSTRSDLEQHKARALKTLQEKEKLIAELQSNESKGLDEAALMELNQLRQERDLLREENQQASEQLRIVREELISADIKLEKMREKSVEANMEAQEILATEKRRRLDAEEDAKLHTEEIRSLKDELIRQRNSYSSQIQKHDCEIAKLRMQLSASSTPSSEVESRLASLTQTLVMKQQALESLTTERNALRLQLEKIEHEFRNTRRNVTTYNNINDTDDAKAQVPTFFMETPFDTGVTRRVKRAYSSLDAISIRTGVFLRRYPLARILVLIYMGLLQFWVLVVLLSQSPEAH